MKIIEIPRTVYDKKGKPFVALTTVRLYDSIRTAPESRYNAMQRFLLIDAGIGNTLTAIDTHDAALTEYAMAGLASDVYNLLITRRLAYYAMLTGYDAGKLAWAVLIHDVDGVPLPDLTEETLQAVVADLNAKGLTSEMIADSIEEVKKNCPPNWRSPFPNREAEETADFSTPGVG